MNTQLHTKAAFFRAAFAGDTRMVGEVLGARPEWVTERMPSELVPDGALEHTGYTALHLAVHGAHPETIRMLVRNGADLEARNAEGRRPLHVALEHANTVRALLLELGAEVDAAAAAALGNIERLRELQRADTASLRDDRTGLTPLGWAAYFGAVDAGRFLLEQGADPNDGALLCAAQTDNVAFGELLLDHGADPNRTLSDWGGTALHAAASMRYTPDATAFVRLLLERGADVDVLSSRGRTPLQVALAGEQQGETAKRPAFAAVAGLLRSFGA